MALTRVRALQISNIDYKQAVRVITTTNISNLGSGAPDTVDGVSLNVNDRILVNGQNTGSQNGLYYVVSVGTGADGVWARTVDGNDTGEISAGMIVMVTEGNTYADSQWKLTTNNPITVGTTPLTFQQASAFAFGNVYANGTAILADTVGDTITLTPANNIVITGNATSDTVTFAVSDSPTFQTVTAGNIIPSANATYSLGNATNQWKSLYVSGNTIYIGPGQISAVENSVTLTGAGGATLTIDGANNSVGTATATFISAVANVNAGNLLTGGIVSATGAITGANITGANLLTGGIVSATGTITGGNVATGGTVSATGTGTFGNLATGGTVSATGTGTFGNLATGGTVSATGTITGGNVATGGTISAGGNVTGANLLTAGLVSATGTGTFGNLATGGTVSATGTITGGNVATGGTVSATGTGTFGNVATGGTLSAAGNATAGNLNTSGLVNAGQLQTSGNAIIGGDLVVNGNVTYINITDLNVQDPIIGLGRGENNSPLTSNDGKDRGEQLWYFNTAGNVEQSAFIGYDNSTGNLIAAVNVSIANEIVTVNSFGTWQVGDLYGQSVTATGTVTGGNLATGGTVSATGTGTFGNVATTGTLSAGGNVTGANVLTGGMVSASGNVYGATLIGNVQGNITSETISVSGNIIGGNLLTGGIVSSTGTVTGGNVATGGTVSAAGTVTGGNVATGGTVSATGTGTFGNVATTGTVSATGDVTGGNVATGGTVSATGTVTGGNLVTSGTASATGTGTFGNVATGGTVSAAGTVTGGNLVTSGTASVTGTITGGNVATSGTVSATGTVTGGNVATSGTVSATGTGTFGNLDTGGTVSATGNITGGNVEGTTLSGNLVGTSASLSGSVSSSTVSASGTITGGNLATGGTVSATGNITGGNLSGTNISGTLTTAAQPNITSVGTLTSLNSGTISSSGTITGTTLSGTTLSGNLVGTTASLSGTVTGGNVATSGTVSATGNITGGNISTSGNVATGGILTDNYYYANGAPVDFQQPAGSNTQIQFNSNNDFGASAAFTFDSATNALSVGGTVSSSGTITGGNLVTGGTASATGTITGGNLATGGTVSATGTITGGNVATGGTVSATGTGTFGNLATGGTVSATGTITGGNVATGGTVSATGTITGGNVATSGTLSATGNATAGNLNTSGLVNAGQLQTSGNAVIGGDLVVNGNVTYINITDLNVQDPIIGLGRGENNSPLTSNDGKDRGEQLWYYSSSEKSAFIGYDNSTGNLIAAVDVSIANEIVTVNSFGTWQVGDLYGQSVVTSGNLSGGNILTGGLISATGSITGANITGANLLTAGLISATGTITGGNVATGGTVSATGTGTFGNLATGGTVSATGTITGGNVATGGTVSATGNITGGNIATAGQANLGNIVISGDNITDTNGRVNFNTALGDVDFAVNGLAANVFYVDAGSNTASFGSSTQVSGAIVNFGTTNSVKVPVGNIAQRPTGAAGMLRFNNETGEFEGYDGLAWGTIGGTEFTVIADNQFTGDGSTVAFTLSSSQTTNSCIVSINGIVQAPVDAYSVSGTTLTFTEAPEAGDLIDVRELTTTVTVKSIMNSSGNAVIATIDSASQINITGNVIPTANLAYDLGGPSNMYKSLYVGGNTIYLGSLQLKDIGANTFAVYTADGTTEASIAVGSIDVTSLQAGNSVLGINGINGNVYATVGGVANVFVATSTGVNVSGNISATGDIIGQNVNSLSDATLKTNVQKIENAEEVINAIDGYTFDWVDGSGSSYGFIAQLIEAILPHAVKTDPVTGVKSVNYSAVIPFLVEMVKKQGQEIAEIKKQLGK